MATPPPNPMRPPSAAGLRGLVRGLGSSDAAALDHAIAHLHQAVAGMRANRAADFALVALEPGCPPAFLWHSLAGRALVGARDVLVDALRDGGLGAVGGGGGVQSALGSNAAQPHVSAHGGSAVGASASGVATLSAWDDRGSSHDYTRRRAMPAERAILNNVVGMPMPGMHGDGSGLSPARPAVIQPGTGQGDVGRLSRRYIDVLEDPDRVRDSISLPGPSHDTMHAPIIGHDLQPRTVPLTPTEYAGTLPEQYPTLTALLAAQANHEAHVPWRSAIRVVSNEALEEVLAAFDAAMAPAKRVQRHTDVTREATKALMQLAGHVVPCRSYQLLAPKSIHDLIIFLPSEDPSVTLTGASRDDRRVRFHNPTCMKKMHVVRSFAACVDPNLADPHSVALFRYLLHEFSRGCRAPSAQSGQPSDL